LGRVTELVLDVLDVLPLAQKKACIGMSQVMKPHPGNLSIPQAL